MQFYDKRLILAIDSETLKELKKIAKERKIKISQLVRHLIYEEIRRHRKSKSSI